MRASHGFPFVLLILAAAALPRISAAEEGLAIVHAKWFWGKRSADVTEKVRQYVHDDRVNVRATVENLGNPAPNHGKVLQVIYRWKGVEHKEECNEGFTLTLPTANIEETGATYKTDQKQQISRITLATNFVGIPKPGLEIAAAVFGCHGIWRDVTAALQKRVHDGYLQIDAHPPFTGLGGDPAIGREKKLIIGYRVDGKPSVKVYDEMPGNRFQLSIP